jgi:dTDP-L-rhamnose 4-epimerase
VRLNYLVTGGAGFIGCALAGELARAAKADLRMVAFDCLHPQIHPGRSPPEALPPSVDLRVADVCDAKAWDSLLAEFEPSGVVHLAAETGTGQSLEVPTRHTHVNVTGTAQMFEAFDRVGVRPEHIVLASSRAIYGEGQWLDPANNRVFSPGHRPVEQLERGEFKVVAPSGETARPLPQDQAETAPKPVSVYGATKLAQEHIATLWCLARRVPLSILRLQNVYGAGQSPHNPYTGIVGLFHRIAAAGSPIEVYEDGQIGRDFIYIDDVADCIASALKKPPESLRVIDVGTGKVATILDVARGIANLYGAPDPLISGAFRYGDIRWAVAATDGLESNFGFLPRIGLDEGNKRLSAWLGDVGQLG